MADKFKIFFAAHGAHNFDDGYKAAVERVVALDATAEELEEAAEELISACHRNKGVEFDDVRARHKKSCSAKAIREAAGRKRGG